MKVIRYFCISLLLGFVLQGCGVTPTQSDADGTGVKTDEVQDSGTPTESSESPELNPDADLPPADNLVDELDTDVPPHLLYKLLVAEIAGRALAHAAPAGAIHHHRLAPGGLGLAAIA
ncbi:MAG: hypothetical protein R3240_06065, partial [Gammaproteobacteria bacterium]|nr:hypothetical protein [Gammaproteobacteria bacterium]